jgi:predicted nucleic acid-binding protein
MGFLLSTDDVQKIDFSGASIYPDACFILIFLDTGDFRHAAVRSVWEQFKGQDVTIGVGAQTYSEVVSVLLRDTMFKALEEYHKWKDDINKKGIQSLNTHVQKRLVQIDAVRWLYKIAKSLGHTKKTLEEHQIREITKRAKLDVDNRHLLRHFYNRAYKPYQAFEQGLCSLFGCRFEFLETAESDRDFAQAIGPLFTMEPADAIHLSVAHTFEYDFFITADRDFVHSYYADLQEGQPRPAVKIVNVA